MVRLTFLFGLLLVLLGLAGYWESGKELSVAVAPAAFGVVLAILGSTARSGSAKVRMVVMHIAVVVGLIGFLVTVGSAWDYVQMQRGNFAGDKVPTEIGAATSLILLFFVLLCVRSFINARRTRQAI